MKLKHAVKHNGTHYPEGPYPGDNKRLPKQVEEFISKKGYFEAGDLVDDEPTELTEAQQIAGMKVDDLADAIKGKDDEFLNEVLEAEMGGKDRSTAIEAIQEEMDAD